LSDIRTGAHRQTTRTKLSRSIFMWTVCTVEYEVFLQIESILILIPTIKSTITIL